MEVELRIETPRLVLRRPREVDAEAILARYAADPDVTHYLGWPRHRSLDDTRAFLRFSDVEWDRAPAGPYLIFSREDDRLLGSTGLAFRSPTDAEVGYVLARDAWGLGYASEALTAMMALARRLGVTELSARCHVDHRPSRRVLEKAGFTREDEHGVPMLFPNLDAARPQAALVYRYAFSKEE